MSQSLSANTIHHIGVAVHSIEESSAHFELVSGTRCSEPETLETQGVRVAFVGEIELLEPLGPDTTVGRFLERRGQGLHHVAYRTPNIVTELARLEASGMRLIDREPRSGAHGHRVAFVHPSSTGGILVELVEDPADVTTHDRSPT